MQNILFPTDFSDNSNQAYPYALDIAYLLGANLTIFNSYKLPYSKSNLLVSMIDRMKEDSEKELNDLRKKAAMAINNNENSSEVSEEDFDAVADFLIEDNLELLKRLA